MSDNIKFIATVCSSVIGVSLGLFGLGYAIGSRKKMNAVSDIVEKSVDDIFADGKVDIPKDLINETIKEQVTKNVEITVQRKVDEACDDAVLKVRTSIYNSIRESAEKVTQLNRSVDNNLMSQIEYLTNLLYSQLGITQSILDGTADEKTMLNYYNRSIEPIVSAMVDEMKPEAKESIRKNLETLILSR